MRSELNNRTKVSPQNAGTGFTLVEILVVVAIIAILTAVSLPAMREYRVKASQSAVKAVLLDIAARQEQYAAKNLASASRLSGVGTYEPYATDLGVLGLALPDEVVSNYSLTMSVSSVAVSASNTIAGFTATATPVAGSLVVNTGSYQINQFGLRLKCADDPCAGSKVRW